MTKSLLRHFNFLKELRTKRFYVVKEACVSNAFCINKALSLTVQLRDGCVKTGASHGIFRKKGTEKSSQMWNYNQLPYQNSSSLISHRRARVTSRHLKWHQLFSSQQILETFVFSIVQVPLRYKYPTDRGISALHKKGLQQRGEDPVKSQTPSTGRMLLI